MTFSVYGRGSWFAGAPAPKDIDLMVVTDGPRLDPTTLRGLLGLPAGLPLDVHYTSPEGPWSIYERAVIGSGIFLYGTLLDSVPVTWPEWAFYMGAVASEKIGTEPELAAMHAVRGTLAPEHGCAPSSRYVVLQHAEGTRWEGLAAASWAWRPGHGRFAHQDLDDAVLACWATALGDEIVLQDGTHAGVRYRGVFDPTTLAAVRTGPEDSDLGGWHKATVEDYQGWGQMLLAVAIVAALGHNGPVPSSIDAPAVHRYPIGVGFPPHVDRVDGTSDSFAAQAAHEGVALDVAQAAVAHRDANVIVSLSPSPGGGFLQVREGRDAPPRTVGLHPGDVAVIDAKVWHGVTPPVGGERRTIVAHSHTDA